MELDKHDQLLAGMAMQYQQLAMMALGKLARPDGKVQRDLQEASFFIDIVEMLSVKTEGNTANEVKTMLESALQDLRLNYVDEAAKPEEKQVEASDASDAPADDQTESAS